MKRLYDMNTFICGHPLARNSKLRAWKRFLSWQLRSRLKKELVEPWIEGQSLVVRKGMEGATGNLYAGLHEFVDMMLLLHFLRDGDLFFDIGGNVGSYTVLAAGVCHAPTWVFEPDPQTARDLARNVELNALGHLVTLHQVALSAQDGDLPFTVGLKSINHVATPDDRDVQTVPARALDSIADNFTPVMMKLDVEGHEEQVLRGARELLKRSELKLLEIETVTPWMGALLQDEGFIRAYYRPLTRDLTKTPNGQRSSNEIYVRDWAFVQSRLVSARSIEVFGQRI